MTIETLCHALGIPVERGLKLAAENGVRCGSADTLTEAQMEMLQIVLLRLYRPGSRKDPPKPAAPRQPVVVHEPIRVPAPEPAPAEPEKTLAPACSGPVNPIMERLVLEKKILIDTCSLMHDKCADVIGQMIPAMEKHGKKLLVPEKVIAELNKHHRCRTDPGKAAAADRALGLCRLLKARGCLSVRGESRDNFADNTFYVALSQYRTKYHMLLITQDRGLTRDVLKLNEVRSVKGYPIEVMYVNAGGGLSRSSSY